MKSTIIAISGVLLSGCGLHSVNDNTREVWNSDHTLITSADTRAILKVPVTRDDATGLIEPETITCAEPSPDIARLVSEASTGTAKLGAGLPSGISASVAFGLARGHSEGMAQLTDRLATIQILRDSLYRACEAYANGAIDRTGYALVLAHSERLMFGLLMAELISGHSAPPLQSIPGQDLQDVIIPGAQLDQSDAEDKLKGAIQSLVKSAPRILDSSPNLLGLLTKRDLSSADRNELSAITGKLPKSVQKLTEDVQQASENLEHKKTRLQQLLSVLPLFAGESTPRETSIKPVHSTQSDPKHTVHPATSSTGTAAVSSDSAVEIARIQVMGAMTDELVERPTLDGLEVACLTLLTDQKIMKGAYSNGTFSMQDFCRAALLDIAKTKISKNGGKPDELMQLGDRGMASTKP